jgi:hypothetical protein
VHQLAKLEMGVRFSLPALNQSIMAVILETIENGEIIILPTPDDSLPDLSMLSEGNSIDDALYMEWRNKISKKKDD